MRLTCGKCDNGWICEEHPDLRRAGVCRARTPRATSASSQLVAAKIGDTARSRMN